MTSLSLQPESVDSQFTLGSVAANAAAIDVSRPANIRVLHVINGEHYSGAERVQDLLARGLPEFGFDVGFVCLKPVKFPSSRQYRSAPVYEVPMQTRFDWRAVRRVVGISRSEGYTLIHAHTPRSLVVARLASAWAKLPLVYHVHSPTSHDSTRPFRNFANHWTERLSLTGAAGLVTVSHHLRQYMIAQGWHPDRVLTVSNGVPEPLVHRGSDCPIATWTIGTTALFRPRKGLEVLLEAVAILKQQGVLLRLKAVGPFETSDYERDIRGRVEKLRIGDSIQWTGFTSNVAAELATMDLFVLPSLFGEGLPMVVLEAMAAGVPVVATRITGIPEAIEHGISGLLANPNDPADLANCIRGVMEGEFNWSALRQAALARHANEFSDTGMAEKLAEVYRRILGCPWPSRSVVT